MKSETNRYILPKSIRIINKGEQHVVVNISTMTWAKINSPLKDIITNLENASFNTILENTSNQYSISEVSIRRSLEWLVDRGILEKHNSSDTSCKVSQYEEILERQPYPYNMDILLDVTERCNQKCSYCYVDSSYLHGKTWQEPSLENIKEIAHKLKTVNPRYIIISGGEPLLRLDLVDILNIIQSIIGCPVRINTNGTLLDKSKCRELIPLIKCMLISLDGSCAEIHDSITGIKGSFDKTINGIKILKAEGMQEIVISPTIHKHNLHDLPNIISLAKDLGVDFSFSYLINPGNTDICSHVTVSEKDEYELEEKSWRKCLELQYPSYPTDDFYKGYVKYAKVRCAACAKLYILSDGSMYPCPGLRRKNDYEIGNIYECDNLATHLQTSDVYSELFAKHVDYNPVYSKCPSCEVRYFCGSYCLGREITDEGCYWIKKIINARLWQYQEGVSLYANVDAMYNCKS
ncbi:MAG: radical SAM protein [Armatimonadota bacterium]